MDIKSYLKEKKEAVDSFLESCFGASLRPAVLREAVLHSLLAGGKRLRPVLALASFEACGKNPEEIIKYASALELIHTYSLIHDDLPVMDNDDLRRGIPTCHKVYGEAMAILAGDALLTEAFRLLSEPEGKIRPVSLLRGIWEVSTASGISGMVAGQAEDIISENSEPDKDTLSFIHQKKTASLIEASVRLGAILAEAPAERLDALGSYGKNIGLAFQIVDDILDIEGDTEELGKTTGSDERKKKMTYPALYGIHDSREAAKTLLSGALDSLRGFSGEAEPLREIARYIIDRRS